MRFSATSDPELERLMEPPQEAAGQPAEPVQTRLIVARLLWDHRAFIWQWCVRGLLIALVIAVLVPNRYLATTRLMPPDSSGGSGMAMISALVGKAGAPGLSSLASDLLGSKTSGALYMEALRSRTVEDRLVNRFDLRRVYWVRYMEQARSYLEDNTSISEDHKSGVITVAVNDRNRQRSAALAQAYVEELNRLMSEVSTSSARRERVFIEQRLVTVKQDLHHAAEEFSQFASQNTTLDVPSQTKAMVEAGADLQGNLMAAQSELEGLEQIYTSSNVRVRSLRARVTELRRQLGEMAGAKPNAVAGAVPNDQVIGSQPTSNQPPDMIYPSIRKLPLLAVRWAELYQQAKIQETVYQLLTQEYELAKIQEVKEIPTAKVMDEASLPERKSFPPRIVFVILGALLGLLTGSVIVLGLSFWQAIEPEDPAKEFTLEVLRAQKAWVARRGEQFRRLFSRSPAPPPLQHSERSGADD
jgi:capsule polysaccharide export protein KpsE/RkpR